MSGTRGSGRPARGRARGGYASFNSRWSPPDPIPVDLGAVLETISKDDIKPTESKQTVIGDVKCAASFNWVGGIDKPIIVTPGAPPKWAPPKDQPQLKEDSGTYYRDVNAAFMPKSPLQAATLTVLADPDADTRSIDLMACASTLRSLLLFVRGERKTFRIMATAVGETVFFLRREGSPREVIPDVHGFGHSMPEAYTMWDPDVKGSVSHQRVVRYDFAGMDCLVRYEPDGYLPSKLPGVLPTSSRNDAEPSADFDIDAAFCGVDLSTKVPQGTIDGLTVKKGGFPVPQAATFELKTRTSKRKHEDFFTEFAARLWITQTPYFILAFHNRGIFDDVRVRDVRKDVQDWEADNQADIRKLAGLLELIMTRVRAKGVLELWRHEGGNLQLRKPRDEDFGALPLHLEDKWTGVDNGGGVMV